MSDTTDCCPSCKHAAHAPGKCHATLWHHVTPICTCGDAPTKAEARAALERAVTVYGDARLNRRGGAKAAVELGNAIDAFERAVVAEARQPNPASVEALRARWRAFPSVHHERGSGPREADVLAFAAAMIEEARQPGERSAELEEAERDLRCRAIDDFGGDLHMANAQAIAAELDRLRGLVMSLGGEP